MKRSALLDLHVEEMVRTQLSVFTNNMIQKNNKVMLGRYLCVYPIQSWKDAKVPFAFFFVNFKNILFLN